MTIVVLVCSIDQGLQFRYIVRVGKVDNINGNVVLSEALAQVALVPLDELLGLYSWRAGVD